MSAFYQSTHAILCIGKTRHKEDLYADKHISIAFFLHLFLCFCNAHMSISYTEVGEKPEGTKIDGQVYDKSAVPFPKCGKERNSGRFLRHLFQLMFGNCSRSYGTKQSGCHPSIHPSSLIEIAAVIVTVACRK